ncbi:MAG: phosphopentomutase [Buchnera aphidicola (Eriosoma harunire)]
MNRVFVLLLDSFGIGSSLDADKFNDVGANTFGHINEMCFLGKANLGRFGCLRIPNLISLGLGHLYHRITGEYPVGLDININVKGSYAYASAVSMDKDTLSGHFEIMGSPLLRSLDRFVKKRNSFPMLLLDKIIKESNITGFLGNCHSSGLDVLTQFGEEHMKTGKPIFYTSSDSVFQIACHEQTFGLDRLYKLSLIVRDILNNNDYYIGRVIARPFIGLNQKNFKRTCNRRDYSILPNNISVLEKLIIEKQGHVIGIGKVADIFSGVGFTKTVISSGLLDLLMKTIHEIQECPYNSIIFTNFSDFDSIWGHRRDVSGYAKGLELFDIYLLNIINHMDKQDLLIITADHGCDPTWVGFDHTREYIPILLYQIGMSSMFLGHRRTFSDIAQTIATFFSLSRMQYGLSMM